MHDDIDDQGAKNRPNQNSIIIPETEPVNHEDLIPLIGTDDAENTDIVQPPNPLNQPRRSSRAITKTTDKSEGVVRSSRLEDAIRQSKESAQRKVNE